MALCDRCNKEMSGQGDWTCDCPYEDLLSSFPGIPQTIDWVRDCRLSIGFRDWTGWEQKEVRPYLESLGWTKVHFYMGESDSFGPLSRIVVATDPHGTKHYFVYG